MRKKEMKIDGRSPPRSCEIDSISLTLCSTSLIDKDLFLENKITLEELETLFPYKRWNNNRSKFVRLQKKFPALVFMGETNFSRCGTSLYVHRDDNENIDSIIIDSRYFFPMKEMIKPVR